MEIMSKNKLKRSGLIPILGTLILIITLSIVVALFTTNELAYASQLVFRTPSGAVSIPAGQTKQLGSVDVQAFSKIRVVADERNNSPTNVSIRLTITEGSELVAQLDVFPMTPHSQVTRVYDVPGTKLAIFADAASGTGLDAIDVLIYGN